ncbi:hypothetical protein C8R44DRAFT_978494 [Mycena epipterygia]|nr:hypothetical protein C8R44DRAFT_978494 [Mycena epipterygia]
MRRIQDPLLRAHLSLPSTQQLTMATCADRFKALTIACAIAISGAVVVAACGPVAAPLLLIEAAVDASCTVTAAAILSEAAISIIQRLRTWFQANFTRQYFCRAGIFVLSSTGIYAMLHYSGFLQFRGFGNKLSTIFSQVWEMTNDICSNITSFSHILKALGLGFAVILVSVFLEHCVPYLKEKKIFQSWRKTLKKIISAVESPSLSWGTIGDFLKTLFKSGFNIVELLVGILSDFAAKLAERARTGNQQILREWMWESIQAIFSVVKAGLYVYNPVAGAVLSLAGTYFFPGEDSVFIDVILPTAASIFRAEAFKINDGKGFAKGSCLAKWRRVSAATKRENH